MTEPATGRGSDQLEAENAELRQRVAQLERELADVTASANEAIAAAQDRAYWLDRWQLDLNGLMERRGADELRAALRVLRGVYRRVKSIVLVLRAR